jgi:hypothetical protein
MRFQNGAREYHFLHLRTKREGLGCSLANLPKVRPEGRHSAICSAIHLLVVRYRAVKSPRLGVALLEMPRKTRTKPHSTNILDYPSNLSMYEKESLASEARIAADRKKDKLERLNSHAGRINLRAASPRIRSVTGRRGQANKAGGSPQGKGD